MYLNGVLDNQFIGYNSNLAGVPAGGYLYGNINYGGLRTYFNGTYFCMDDGTGNVRPYISFDNVQNFMSFMVDFYKNKVDVYNSTWSTNRAETMSAMYVDYWPFSRFGDSGQNSKDRLDWIKNNESTLQSLKVKADETLALMKTNNLL